VVHLGAIDGEAACALDEPFTLSTNVEATGLIAERCGALGVPRLVFASTCDVYGAGGEVVDEATPPNPASCFARSKLAAERLLLDRAEGRTAPVIVRLGDAYGVSYRPRFDLAVNAAVARAVALGRAEIGGERWRPFVHVDDVARALVAVVEAPLGRVAQRVFNVGAGEQGEQVRELGAWLGVLLPGAEVRIAGERPFRRVSCERLRAAVGFEPVRGIADGVAELVLGLGGTLRCWREPLYDNGVYLEQLIATQPGILAPAGGGRLLRVVRGVPGRTPPRHRTRCDGFPVATLP
jgi:nucleoside-diphosphate-sugar epimerase